MGDKQVKIIQEVGVDWMNLGIRLEFDYNLLKAIERDYRYIHKICYELLNRWLNGEGCQPVTWATLIQVLSDAEHAGLADRLRLLLSSQD